MRKMTALALTVIAALALPVAAQAVKPEARPAFFFKDGETILFLGDSITYGELYVQDIEAYLFTRLPDKRFHIVSRGIPSETVAGTSEPTHDPPRPDLHTRFTRTAVPFKPDVILACYGMNDGIYRSPNDEVFAKYQAGIQRLIRRVKEETPARLVLLSPPPYDHRPHADKQRPADQAQPDYRFPAPDYDDALAHFARWLVSLRARGLTVVDLHTPMAQVLAARMKDDPQFILSPDGVHPNPTGHWLMAQAVLAALDAPGTVADVVIDAKMGQASGGKVSGLKTSAKTVRFYFTAPLPLPIDPRVDRRSLQLARTNETLNRYRLTVKNLPAGKYALKADDQKLATFSAAELASGIDLMKVERFPTHARAAEVLQLVQQRRKVLQEVWIKDEPSPRMASTRAQLLKNSQATQAEADELLARICTLCQPREIGIELAGE